MKKSSASNNVQNCTTSIISLQNYKSVWRLIRNYPHLTGSELSLRENYERQFGSLEITQTDWAHLSLILEVQFNIVQTGSGCQWDNDFLSQLFLLEWSGVGCPTPDQAVAYDTSYTTVFREAALIQEPKSPSCNLCRNAVTKVPLRVTQTRKGR